MGRWGDGGIGREGDNEKLEAARNVMMVETMERREGRGR